MFLYMHRLVILGQGHCRRRASVLTIRGRAFSEAQAPTYVFDLLCFRGGLHANTPWPDLFGDGCDPAADNGARDDALNTRVSEVTHTCESSSTQVVAVTLAVISVALRIDEVVEDSELSVAVNTTSVLSLPP